MSAIADAVEICGGPTKLAALLSVTPQAVCYWRTGERRLPADHCAAIEAATEGRVKRWDLRPFDWHRIWPELIGAEGAPPVEAKEAA